MHILASLRFLKALFEEIADIIMHHCLCNDLHTSVEFMSNALLQAIEEDPDDAIQWHQLGLHNLCTMQFKASVKFLKAAVARSRECSFAWSNLGNYFWSRYLVYFFIWLCQKAVRATGFSGY